MKRVLLIIGIALFGNLIWGQKTLLECGQNSGTNFNGWYIYPHSLFDAIEFDAHSTSFFSEEGGNFSVSVSRKVSEMKSYKELNVLFNFEALHNCTLDNVVYATSTDGKKWTPINTSRNNAAIRVANDLEDIAFVKATANATFFENGKLALDYAKIEGYDTDVPALAQIEEEANLLEDTFYIFSHQHSLNIETPTDKPYEVLITSITGQIVYREAFEGSNRIDLPQDISGVHVVTIIQDNDFKASRKVIF